MLLINFTTFVQLSGLPSISVRVFFLFIKLLNLIDLLAVQVFTVFESRYRITILSRSHLRMIRCRSTQEYLVQLITLRRREETVISGLTISLSVQFFDFHIGDTAKLCARCLGGRRSMHILSR